MRLLVSSAPTALPSLLPDFAPWLGTLVTPSNGALPQAMRLWTTHGIPWAADNEAFAGFNPAAYRRMLARLRGLPGCVWVAVPDAVGDAAGTLALFREWKDEVRGLSGQPLAFVGQDGIGPGEIPWGEFDCWFVGGSTEWKLASGWFAREAVARGKWCHMGRVNSFRRYDLAHAWGCHSVDGTNVCRWPDVHLPRCLRWLARLDQQGELFRGAAHATRA